METGSKWDLRRLKMYLMSRHGPREADRMFHEMQLIIVRRVSPPPAPPRQLAHPHLRGPAASVTRRRAPPQIPALRAEDHDQRQALL